MTETVNPLKHLLPDAGLCPIFETVGFIGDSLASGEFESTTADGGKGYHDMYRYSWGKFMARKCGFTGYNFSRGGMTAEWFLREFGKQCGFYDSDKKCQVYYVALGVNDLMGQKQTIGSAADYDPASPEHAEKTFAWYYGKLLSEIKAVQPKARVFLVTIPDYNDGRNHAIARDHAALLHDFASKNEYTYVIDLFALAPTPYDDEDFRRAYYLGSHMNPMGYLLTAEYMIACTDHIIRTHYEDFVQLPFIGTPFHNDTAKW